MPKYHIEFEGVGEVKRKLGAGSAKKLRSRVGLIIEEGTRNMAEQAYQNAPKDTTALAQSILASVTKERPLQWFFGSTMPYAQRQEYEHDGNKHDPTPRRYYFRKAINQEKPVVRARLKDTVKDHFS